MSSLTKSRSAERWLIEIEIFAILLLFPSNVKKIEKEENNGGMKHPQISNFYSNFYLLQVRIFMVLYYFFLEPRSFSKKIMTISF